MKQFKMDTKRAGEKGNVLFLILIAVALFAALSYGVTQSTRSSSGNASGETNLISSAQLTQYPAGVRTSVVRMIIGGTAVEELEFNSPSDFNDITEDSRGVFYPQGGNATYQLAPPEVMADETQGVWHFNGEFEIDNIGSEDAGSFDGNDIVAFLPNIKLGICQRINRELGISTLPVISSSAATQYNTDMVDGYTIPTGETILGTAGSNGTNDLTGQPFGCFRNTSATPAVYVYYHVLIER